MLLLTLGAAGLAFVGLIALAADWRANADFERTIGRERLAARAHYIVNEDRLNRP